MTIKFVSEPDFPPFSIVERLILDFESEGDVTLLRQWIKNGKIMTDFVVHVVLVTDIASYYSSAECVITSLVELYPTCPCCLVRIDTHFEAIDEEE